MTSWALVMTTTEGPSPAGGQGSSAEGCASAQLLAPSPDNIQECATALKQGQLVAFPTETVFGLGAAVTQVQAVQAIFKAKGRPSEHPLIAHVAPGMPLQGWVAEVTPMMQQLVEAFWPGPLTMVVPRGELMPLEVTGGQNSVGIRCPSHPVAISLLKATGVPVAAPSANRFGKVSPTRAVHVLAELGDRIPYILDGDIPQVGIESTIVSLLSDPPAILRPGAITAQEISTVLGIPVKPHSEVQKNPANNPRVSGALEKHYSPDARVCVMSARQLSETTLLGPVLAVGWTDDFLATAHRLRQSGSQSNGFQLQVEALPGSPAGVARALYSTLRMADELGCRQLVFEQPETAPDWEAVLDRLKRASA